MRTSGWHYFHSSDDALLLGWRIIRGAQTCQRNWRFSKTLKPTARNVKWNPQINKIEKFLGYVLVFTHILYAYLSFEEQEVNAGGLYLHVNMEFVVTEQIAHASSLDALHFRLVSMFSVMGLILFAVFDDPLGNLTHRSALLLHHWLLLTEANIFEPSIDNGNEFRICLYLGIGDVYLHIASLTQCRMLKDNRACSPPCTIDLTSWDLRQD